MSQNKLTVCGTVWVDGWATGKVGNVVVGQRQYMRLTLGGGQYADRAAAVADCGEQVVAEAESVWEQQNQIAPMDRRADGAMQWRKLPAHPRYVEAA